ncbi:mechanosensitive ion channel domain-containing protein [Halomarina ordinaria]|uniref:Mechanosensitive ion channel domain-containing protein n=1 Tax=Halomarina ordinaria TaxID=3033939 RepID=A0ABD5U518_9EURY|nr:mechanosensitive ion channel domain-containing protein [Halomarina sp. PSRA2]
MLQVREFAREVVRLGSESLVPILVLLFGLALGFLVGRLTRRLLVATGVPEAVEGTAFERAAQRLGTSTVGLVATLVTLFIYLATIGAALELEGFLETRLSLMAFVSYIPRVFAAVLVLIVGLIVADKVELVVRERLRGVKLTEVNVLPLGVKYSVIYIALVVALATLGLPVAALLVLLGGYFFAVVVLAALALRDVLPAAAAGVFLLLTQPYGIGDQVEVDGRQGIVQEVGVFVTYVEDDGAEFIVPNHLVFQSGIVRVRD